MHNGDVYSSADPFATAIAFEGETVTWVGSDEAAGEFEGEHVDLEQDFVTPGLVSAAVDLRSAEVSPADLLAAGITSAHLIGESSTVENFAAAAPTELDIVAYPLGRTDATGAFPGSDLARGALPDHQQFALVDSQADLDAVLLMVKDDELRTHAQRYGFRVLLSIPLPEAAVEPLSRCGLAVTLDPLQHDQPLAALLAAGAQLSFALDPVQPWRSLAAAVYSVSDGISARAAFNCATRFGFRAVGRFEAGVLAPGAVATGVRWEVDDLVVQAADSRVASWSTDPRSGTPGLPDLSGAEALPRLRAVWVRGRRVPTQVSSG
nr:metal-dependent hydrolase [Brevibacterium daeguense]